MTPLDQSEYVAARLKELHQCRRNVRANLASARLLWQRRPLDLEARAIVVLALSNLEIANAKIEVLQTPLPARATLRWQTQSTGAG